MNFIRPVLYIWTTRRTMARKCRAHLLSIEKHVEVETTPHLTIFCPHLKSGGMRDIVVCLYKCPKTRVEKCREYLRIYPTLLEFVVDEKYIEKYGVPVFVVPPSLRKRRKRTVVRVALEIGPDPRPPIKSNKKEK